MYFIIFIKNAPAENRTRVKTLEEFYHTTRPQAPLYIYTHIFFLIYFLIEFNFLWRGVNFIDKYLNGNETFTTSLLLST